MARAAQTGRSNEEWIAALGSQGREASQAQEELRTLVLAALRKGTGSFGVLDEATLEDLTQVAVLRILAKLERFEGRSRFSTWAYSVALHAAFSELRKASYRRAPGETVRVEAADAVEDAKADPTAPIERQEIVDALHRVIELELSDRQRAAILAELEGVSPAASAAQLGTKRNALYKLLHDARAKLRDGLENAGISDEQVRETFGL